MPEETIKPEGVEQESLEMAPAAASDKAETRPEVSVKLETEASQTEKKSELFYQKILSKVQSATGTRHATDDAKTDAASVAALGDAKTQVKRLVELATHKSVVHAVNVARKLDFYVLDEVHDQLMNDFYDALVEKGMITRE